MMLSLPYAFFSSLIENSFLQAITGLRKEFIAGARLDNLVGTYTAVIGLIESLKDEEAFKNDPNIRLVIYKRTIIFNYGYE